MDAMEENFVGYLESVSTDITYHFYEKNILLCEAMDLISGHSGFDKTLIALLRNSDKKRLIAAREIVCEMIAYMEYDERVKSGKIRPIG